MKKIAAVGFAILLVAVGTARAQYPSLANVQRIYIDKLGNNDDAERFRSVGSRELDHAGFTAVSSPDEADAIVKGTFTFANWGEKSGGQLNFRLVTRDDKELWAGKVDDKIKPERDSLQWVAAEFAKRLKKQKEQTIKAEKRR
jgi:hypothetical protein